MNSTVTKNASEWEAFDETEPDQFAWFAKVKKGLSCMQGTEPKQEEETERLESNKQTKKMEVAMDASILQKHEIRSEETSKA